MASESTPHLLVLLGEEPLRKWERMALDALHATDGVLVTHTLARANEQKERRLRIGGPLFRHYVQRATGATAVDDRARLPHPAGAEAGPADAILLLAGAEAPAGVSPRCGIWRFITEEGTDAHVLPPGIAAALMRRHHVEFHLVDTTSNRLLRTGCFPVDQGDPYGTADRVLSHAAIWPAQVMADLVRHAPDGASISAPEPMPVEVPGAFTMLLRTARRLLLGDDRVQGKVDEGAFGEWNIGVLHQPIHALLQEHSSTNVRWFPSPGKGRGRVEPFGYRATDDELNVLYRKTDNENGASVIARLRPKPDNILKRSRTMLHSGTDHAYPFTVIVDGITHVLRTDHANDRTEILRLNEQNDGLGDAITLLPVALHAPTLFLHDGRWWLMGTRDPFADAALQIHHGASPLGPFVSHVQNPVKCDVRSSRPAGTPFVHGGTLWRPALDASDPHEYAVVLNKVVTLTPDRFTEEPHRRVEGFASTAYGVGVRTLSAMGEVTFVDGSRSPVVEGSKANASRSKGHRRRHKQHSDE